jgi:hypothetical protein
LGFVAGVVTEYLAAELVRGTRLPLTNALDLRGVQRIDLRAALPVILETHPHRQGQEVGEALLESIIACDAMGVVNEPVEDGIGISRVAEHSAMP